MGAQTSLQDPIPTPSELVARAAAMIPTLRERSAKTEEIRQIPVETVADFKQAGFMRAAVPKRFAGYNYGIDTITQIAVHVGRGCGSSAWMAAQWPGHNFMVSLYSLEAQEEYFATGPDTMSSTASAIAKLDMQPERGGWRIRDSQLRFSSGCDYAQWIQIMGQHGIGLIPRTDFEVLDDWRVAGLRGTGSKSVVIRDAFIPPYRFLPFEVTREGKAPGALSNDNPFQRAPLVMVLNQLLLAATIGMAIGVCELFESRVGKRFDLHTGKPSSHGAGAQLRFAESTAEVDVAEMLLAHNCATLEKWGRAEHVTEVMERVTMRRNTTYAAKLALQSALRLTTQGDASGMFDSNPLGRMGRDIQMAALQASLTWDEPAQAYSRVRWGVEGPISYLSG
jgi:3-hydroxy-9,10-secoandrosta-1,3,5(10)-triene-9,17-dione monooxygenase